MGCDSDLGAFIDGQKDQGLGEDFGFAIFAGAWMCLGTVCLAILFREAGGYNDKTPLGSYKRRFQRYRTQRNTSRGLTGTCGAPGAAPRPSTAARRPADRGPRTAVRAPRRPSLRPDGG